MLLPTVGSPWLHVTFNPTQLYEFKRRGDSSWVNSALSHLLDILMSFLSTYNIYLFILLLTGYLVNIIAGIFGITLSINVEWHYLSYEAIFTYYGVTIDICNDMPTQRVEVHHSLFIC